ncbi:RlpA-like double-psi beta-barrel-protein domain-containing protein-containing protein [Mycena epipterygia]|nr:RlpA-like double-psi beta-barrel-protein domain-containing protein-containing protein [Mycena epipterygia]
MRSVLSLLLLALPLALADHQPHVNHRELAKRAKGDLEKRDSFTNARWTFYSTGLGACGGFNTDSDFIVALNQDTFGTSYPSKYCNKQITMTYNGKTTTATITDSCPGCPSPGGLDLSPGLFSFFGSQDLGVIQGTWWFNDGTAGDSGTTTTKQPAPPPPPPTTTKHTTTSTTHTTPTSTYTPPTTTTTSTTSTKKSSTTTSTTTTTSSKAASSSSSVTPSKVSSISLAASSGTVSATSTADPENLYTFAQVMLDLTGVVVAGADAA